MEITSRQEFLRDIAITAVEGGIGYWASFVKYKWFETESIDNLLPFPVIRIVPAEDPDDFDECDITAATISWGLALAGVREIDLRDEYRGTILTATVMNDASNIDADIADCIVQLGLFGEIVFG